MVKKGYFEHDNTYFVTHQQINSISCAISAVRFYSYLLMTRKLQQSTTPGSKNQQGLNFISRKRKREREVRGKEECAHSASTQENSIQPLYCYAWQRLNKGTIFLLNSPCQTVAGIFCLIIVHTGEVTFQLRKLPSELYQSLIKSVDLFQPNVKPFLAV